MIANVFSILPSVRNSDAWMWGGFSNPPDRSAPVGVQAPSPVRSRAHRATAPSTGEGACPPTRGRVRGPAPHSDGSPQRVEVGDELRREGALVELQVAPQLQRRAEIGGSRGEER